jgi:deoxyribodipyrimidine photo-lyase
VFNPDLQLKKFDSEQKYIAKWAPEYLNQEAPIQPMMDHSVARKQAIDFYKQAEKK